MSDTKDPEQIKPVHDIKSSENPWINYVVKPLGLLAALYVFILSITLLGDSFKLFGKDFAETLLRTTSNPVVGLFIGILATSVIQSSSTTTSIVVGMVAGGLVTIEGAIPIVMGANIGTTITNTLVSMAHITRSNEFTRAYSGAVVHDVFNILAVAVLFPLQLATNFLSELALWLEKIFEDAGGLTFISPVKVITKPLSKFIIHTLNDNPWISAILAILLLFIALKFIVDIMKSVVVTKIEGFFNKYVFKTTFRSLLLGIILTSIVQSSSITTSLVVPLVGAGILTLHQIFPYTLGANIGTTITAIMAALVTQNVGAVAVAFAHLLFNICGIAIFLPIRFIPIAIAKKLAQLTVKNRLIPIGLVILIFFLIPLGLIYILR